MATELNKMDKLDSCEVFSPRLYFSFWIYLVWGSVCGWIFFSELYAGEFKPLMLIWLLLSILCIWGTLSNFKNERWIVKGTVLENHNGKKNPVRSYDINKIKSVREDKSDRFWTFPWSRVEVKINFVDRSQTKSIEPLTVEVKDHKEFIQALRNINPEIQIVQ